MIGNRVEPVRNLKVVNKMSALPNMLSGVLGLDFSIAEYKQR